MFGALIKDEKLCTFVLRKQWSDGRPARRGVTFITCCHSERARNLSGAFAAPYSHYSELHFLLDQLFYTAQHFVF